MMRFIIDNLAYIIILVIFIFGLIIGFSMLNGEINDDIYSKPIEKIVTIESMI